MGEPRVPPRKKNSPSRLRFRPLSPLTVRFRVEPSSCASTYSRSVLGARGKLLDRADRVKVVFHLFDAICDEFVSSTAQDGNPHARIPVAGIPKGVRFAAATLIAVSRMSA